MCLDHQHPGPRARVALSGDRSPYHRRSRSRADAADRDREINRAGRALELTKGMVVAREDTDEGEDYEEHGVFSSFNLLQNTVSYVVSLAYVVRQSANLIIMIV